MYRVVFDTVVFVRSLINPYSHCGRLVFEYADSYELVLSQPVVEEIVEVLTRPALVRKYRSVATRDPAVILGLLGQTEMVDPSDATSISRDPKDDKFLTTAEAAQADFLVTEDEDLLVLKRYGKTEIVSTRRFLETLDEAQLWNDLLAGQPMTRKAAAD